MYRHRHNCNHHGNDSGMGCLVLVILGLMAMPLVGIYMMLCGEDTDQKAIGLILTIVGIILWIMAAV